MATETSESLQLSNSFGSDLGDLTRVGDDSDKVMQDRGEGLADTKQLLLS